MEFGSSFVSAETEQNVQVELDADENLWDDASQIFAEQHNPPAAVPPNESAPGVVPGVLGQQAALFGSSASSSARPSKASVVKKRVRVANTNVLSVDFGTLAAGVELATGDALVCSNCAAVLNCHSTIATRSSSGDGHDAKQSWTCEFCSNENDIDCAPEEIPKANSVDYIVAPPATTVASEDSRMIVFCIDVSGSMGVSYEIQGKVQLRGHEKLGRLQSTLDIERNHYGQQAEQRLPNERHDITYITRLQCVQAAVAAQLESLHRASPNTRVGLVTFNNEVTVVGDAAAEPKIINGDRLSNYEELEQFGAQNQPSKSIQESKDGLIERLFSLEEGGSTALGPALVTAVSMCSALPGSKIVLCTDGLSNVGLGALDELHSEAQHEAAAGFYEQLARSAQQRGVSISVVSIKGSDCSIENVGKLAEMTAGAVERVEPLDIAKNFQSILSLPVLATAVKATILLHKGLFIRREGQDLEQSSDVVDIGNVTAESSITVEYGVSPSAQVEFRRLSSLPFQLQISYTRLDGMKCMRVITKSQPITFNRTQAEQAANVDVLSRNAVQQTARIASKGDYAGARLANLSHKVMMSRAVRTPAQQQAFTSYAAQGEAFEAELSSVQRSERAEGRTDAFNDEDASSDEANSEDKKQQTSKARRSARSDTTSTMLYKMKQWK
eukprot:TRINITY_DN7337_c0_g1_i2.p1 TRINITY_DN7337_c0_g1~~TRINITY_DN7337_c0_g1_i2.p1  ORF type:complete len:671 (+),score=201.42 TRINITY_DN7337_c0_g1_i2:186-2198(+)